MFSNIVGLEIFYNKSIFCDDYIYDKINIIFDIDKQFKRRYINNKEKDGKEYFMNEIEYSLVESFKPYLIDLEIEEIYLINKISVEITFLGKYRKINLNDILKKLLSKNNIEKEPPKKIKKI